MNNTMIDYETRVRRNRMRRNRELRIHIAMLTAAAGIILSISVFAFSSVSSDASNDNGPRVYKYYTSVAVLPSDTVESLAKKSACSLGEMPSASDEIRLAGEIRSINHLEEDELPLAGTNLVVPYYSYEFR